MRTSSPAPTERRLVPHNRPLRIGILSYRSNPHSGGQGVYLKNLSLALKAIGHHVEVISGPPDPELPPQIPLTHLPSLDLYNPEALFRVPSARELCSPLNLVEWIGVSSMGFPEPYTFSLRAYAHLRKRIEEFDIIHDNQSLGFGIPVLARLIPTVATIHHPITRDCKVALHSVKAPWKKLKHLRWFSFLGMQKSVTKALPRIITVSQCARDDICADFKVSPHKFRIVPNGIDTTRFYPGPAISRDVNRIIVTNSSDVPLKGLYYLLQALAQIARTRTVRLIVVGSPKKGGGIEKLVRELGIGHLITFTGRIDHQEFVRQYARAGMAVIPSVYEGFGLPAGEAMACGVPVISTTGGALPEVVGDAGILVPPADPAALEKAIVTLLDNKALATNLGQAGYQRVMAHFTWEKAAQKTAAVYRELIDEYAGV